MTTMDRGMVVLETPDKTYELQPTLKAMKAVSRQFGGVGAALQQLQNLNFEAMVFIVKAGASLSDDEKKQVDDHLFRAGLIECMGPVIRFTMALFNGGRLPEDEGTQDASGDGGNG